MAKTILTTKQKSDCYNCRVCEVICPKNAIVPQQNASFFYPQKNDLCIDCHLCEKLCPKNKEATTREFKQQFYAAWNSDLDVIKISSSGGIFSSFASAILENDGVVYGAAFNEDMVVEHARVVTTEGLDALRGSKYVKSDISKALPLIKKDLHEGKTVLFSGTPCQVKALYTYLAKPYENLYTIDLVCHGTPSPIVLKKYIESLEKQYNSKIVEIKFRKKVDDHHSHFYAKFANGEVFTQPFNPESNHYANVFYSNIALTKACVSCDFNNLNRPGDLTIGDYWGFKSEHSNHFGNSLLIVNSEKGLSLVEKANPNLKLLDTTKMDVVKGNPPLREHTIEHPLSDLYQNHMMNMDFETSYKLFLKVGNILIIPIRVIRKVLRKLKK